MKDNTALQKNKLSEMELYDNDTRVKAQNFQHILHRSPAKDEIQVNTQAKNSKYVPISFLEMKLDELFFGLWSTERFNYIVVANEMVGSLEVKYFHPVHKVWLRRIGAGAVMIQQEKGADITDISKKYKNTLTKDFPHLKAECFRNACLSIGKTFGRDLNRDFADQYNPIITDKSDLDEKRKKIITAFDTYKGSDKEDLKKMCADKQKAGEFDEKFADGVASQIGLEL